MTLVSAAPHPDLNIYVDLILEGPDQVVLGNFPGRRPLALEDASMSTTQIPSSSAGGDLLDDIFGSSPEEPASIARDAGPNGTKQTSSLEPSELPSLRRQHVTSGYRDAVFTAKNEHVQKGFDAGYPVGAQIGLRVGTVLGILEGIIMGLEANIKEQKPKTTTATTKKMSNASKEAAWQNTLSEEDRERITRHLEQLRQLHRRAVSELKIDHLFGTTQQLPSNDDGGEWKKPETILANKADPIVRRWEEVARVTKWEENLVAVEQLEDREDA
ncbi:hypothetical protein VTN31DRAFT_5391 [Thermomyces dupontii]|uniref:uncharacterized protein n=1 Tax=Talaromyces thermophilus TaxID=28565 RepID=UPI0037422B16